MDTVPTDYPEPAIPPIVGAIRTVMGPQPLREHDGKPLPVPADRQTFGQDPAEIRYPASGGGWNSGPMISEAKDRRPEYSPASVVLDVLAALRRAGIDLRLSGNQEYRAAIAAGDLLQALGVKPATAPWRRS